MSNYELIKLASVFVYPMGTVFLLTALAGIAYALKRPRFGRALTILAIAWLWICSMPIVSDRLHEALEQHYVYQSVEETPNADLVVVLGGGAFSHDSSWPYPDISGNVDRYWHAARLYRAGRARKVLLSGARDPRRPKGPSEAQLASDFLHELGVPFDDQILDNESRTTREHVKHVAELLDANDMHNFLLVTSASHMRRAEAVFRTVGLKPIPVATDFNTRNDPRLTLWHFIPSVHGLSGSTAAFHEYFGYWFYQIRGAI